MAAFFIDAAIQLVIFLLWASVALVVLRPTPTRSVAVLRGTDSQVFHLKLGDLREQLAKSSETQRIVRIQLGGGLILLVLYTVGFWAWRGQTPGKMALGVRVVRMDGSPIGPGRAMLRYFGYLVSTMVLLGGHLMIGLTRRKRGLHDKIARTYTIKT